MTAFFYRLKDLPNRSFGKAKWENTVKRNLTEIWRDAVDLCYVYIWHIAQREDRSIFSTVAWSVYIDIFAIITKRNYVFWSHCMWTYIHLIFEL